jgi:hypothetical protein
MNYKEYYILLYTVLVGLTVMLYIKKWGELLQMRSYAIYVTVPILWSCIFVWLLLNLFQQQIDLNWSYPTFLGAITTTACYYWIGMLLFPSIEQVDSKNQFAYLDYYEHFRKQHQWVMGFALLAFLISSTLFKKELFIIPDYLLIGCLGLAFFTEHKGLMCLLAWGVLCLLIFV